jgi:hypothetical protein
MFLFMSGGSAFHFVVVDVLGFMGMPASIPVETWPIKAEAREGVAPPAAGDRTPCHEVTTPMRRASSIVKILEGRVDIYV